MLNAILAAIASCALVGVLYLARASDELPRSSLREFMWPKFRTHRMLARFLSIVVLLMITSGAVAPRLPLDERLALVTTLLGALVSMHVLVGALLWFTLIRGSIRKNHAEHDPVYQALMYALSWPLWYRYMRQGRQGSGTSPKPAPR